MYIHNRIAQSTANGPGDRAVVWLQGCTLNCAGCWNKETHLFDKSKDVSIFALADWILEQDVEGVTFSGGEPFQQAPALELLISIVKDKRPGMTFGTFTGYTLAEIKAGKFSWWNEGLGVMVPGDVKLGLATLKPFDFLVAGRYNELQRCDDKPLCGSKNQEVCLLTTRYKPSDFKSNIVEMTIDKEGGLIQITGFPESLDAIDNPHNDSDDGQLACA